MPWWRLLIGLGEHGLVAKVPGGYELNRDHLSYRAIEALLGARDQLQRRVASDGITFAGADLDTIVHPVPG